MANVSDILHSMDGYSAMMQSVETHSNKDERGLKITKQPVPEPPQEGVMVRTVYSGICHSDLHLFDDFRSKAENCIIKPGYVFGHEISGIVQKLGSSVSPECGLRIGDKVMVYPWMGCEKCISCDQGKDNICENRNDTSIGIGPKRGGYSTHVSVPHYRYIFKVPYGVPMQVAAMLPCSGLTAYSAVTKARPFLEQAMERFDESRILVIGSGGLGLWAIRIAKTLFANAKVKVNVADINKEHLKIAETAGADRCINLDPNAKLAASVAHVTQDGGQMCDAVIDFVGLGSTADLGVKCLRKCGTLILVGLAGGNLGTSIKEVAIRQLTIQGTLTGHTQRFRDLIDLIRHCDIPYPDLEFCGLEDVPTALNRLRDGKVKGRMLIDFKL